jgi:molybdopterin-containing oxidoreductase family iron-sulfur binding subunit
LARDLVQAERDGASIHLFASFEGATGSVTHWHPVAPKTEGAVAWGMARLLLEWGAFDRESLAERVVDAPEHALAALAAYTPGNVESATGLPAGELVALARQFARSKPSLALAPADHPASPAAALLNHLAASVNAPGGVSISRGPFFARPLTPPIAPEAWLKALVDGETDADFYWVCDANPAYDAPQSQEVARALADPERVGYIVAMDTHLTETAALADLFLPLATYLEAWGLLEGCLPDGRTYLFLQQPVTRPASEPEKLKDPNADHLSLFSPWPRPLGQSRSMSDVLLALARKRDSEVTAFADTRAYLGDLLRKSWGPGSFEALRTRGIWVSEEGRTPNPSEKVAFVEAIPKALPRSEPGTLYLVGYAPATLPFNFSNTRWGREIQHRSEALMHPQTARKIGVGAGRSVTLRTSAGEATVPVRLVQGIHPDAVALPDGFGHRAGAVARADAEATRGRRGDHGLSLAGTASASSGQRDPRMEPGESIWWAHAGPGVSLRALFPLNAPSRGIQDWGPIVVEVLPA